MMVIWSDKIDCKCLRSKEETSNIIGQKKRPLLKEGGLVEGKGPQINEHTEQQKKMDYNVCTQTRMRHYRPRGAFTQKGVIMESHQNDDQQKAMSRPSTPLLKYSERYHKLRKAIAQKKGSIGRSHEADGHTRASKETKSCSSMG